MSPFDSVHIVTLPSFAMTACCGVSWRVAPEGSPVYVVFVLVPSTTAAMDAVEVPPVSPVEFGASGATFVVASVPWNRSVYGPPATPVTRTFVRPVVAFRPIAASAPSASSTCQEGAFQAMVFAFADGLYVPPVAFTVSVCTSAWFAILPTIRYRLGWADAAAGAASAARATTQSADRRLWAFIVRSFRFRCG